MRVPYWKMSDWVVFHGFGSDPGKNVRSNIVSIAALEKKFARGRFLFQRKKETMTME